MSEKKEKILNNLLPSNILSEMEIERSSDLSSSNEFEDYNNEENEVVDVRIIIIRNIEFSV